MPDGRFLRVEGDDTLQPERFLPTERETFELVEQADGQIALRAHHGRFVAARGRDLRQLRADGAETPGPAETWTLVPVGDDRFALRARDAPVWAVLDRDAPSEPSPAPPREQSVEILRIAKLPELLVDVLALGIQGAVAEELAGRPYEKTRTRHKEKFVELPAPTLRDPGRTKRHRVLSMDEEYTIQARLDGQPTIGIEEMPYLRRRGDDGRLLLIVSAVADVPATGRVRYRVPDRLSASTGFRAVVHIDTIVEVAAVKSGDELRFDPPRALQLEVQVRQLDLSNDILQTLHDPIEDILNHELRERNDRIRDQANRALAKSLADRKFQNPLLYLLP